MTDLVSRINELEEENMFLKNKVDFYWNIIIIY